MSRYGVTVENLLRTLPEVLVNDEAMLALATGIAKKLAEVAEQTRLTTIYANIDTLPEAVLDALATDFKVDWWSYDYSIEEKRQTLKDSWYVHRHLGTKAAVERAISAIYPGTEVSEWFEYGGDPYHFKLLIPVDQTELDPAKHATVLSLAESYKNLRSVLEEIEYYGSGGRATTYAAVAFIGCEITDSATAINY